MVLEVTLTLLGVALIGTALHQHLSQRAALRSSSSGARRTPASYPSLTVIRPIRGLDTGAEENIRAALDHGYPGPVETIFVFDDLSEPAIPIARKAIRSLAPESARILIAGSPPRGRTGKLNAMIAGLRQARGEVIVFADSDIRPDRDALRVLVETLLHSSRTGSAFAPVIAREPHDTAGDAGYALLLNGLYSPAAASAAEQRGGTLPFIMGQFMAFRREALDAIGGLECADGQLVDDMFLGQKVAEAGFENRVSPHPVPIIQQGMSNWDFVKTYRRWIAFSRSGLPGLEFKLASWLRGVVFFTGLALAAVAAAFSPLASILGLAASVAVASSINRLHVAVGGARLRLRHVAVGFVMLLASPLIYLGVFSKRQLTWRGRTYQLDASSKLGAETPPARGAQPQLQPISRAA
jgi:ceramide glucosyltransferase